MVDPTAGRSVGRNLLLWLPVAAWAALIFFLSSESEPPEPAGLAGMPGWSQAAHFGLYLVLGALLYLAFGGSGVRVQGSGSRQGSGVRVQGSGSRQGSGVRDQGTGDGKRTIPGACLLALAAGALYAATDEVHQYFVPSRQADALDWLVDVAGVLAGALSMLAWERKRRGNMGNDGQ